MKVVRALELEQVFVQLEVNPTPIHQASDNPIKVPEVLRNGQHTIWTYLDTKALRSQNFVIIGAPGSGKTTLLKHLALSLARHRKVSVRLLPILLYLRDHATTLQGKYDVSTDTFVYSLAEAVNTHIQRKWQQSLPLSWINRKLTRGQCLVLLDGLDEVADAPQRKLVVKWVQSQMLAYRGNRFLLTSRPHGYRDNPLEGVWVLETRPFTPVQVAQFVQNWYQANEYKSWGKNDAGMQMRAREGAHDLLSRLYRSPTLLAFAVNPLLLTMIATVHRYRGSLPGSRVALYGEICEVFLGKRHAAIGLVQELTPAQMLQVLRPLAYSFTQQGKREMQREEACQICAPHLLRVSTRIQPDEFLLMVQNTSGLLLERAPGLYGFAHKTFQEYLTATYIKEERREQELVAHVQDDWWHETIRLYCALADATAIVRACLVNDPPTASALALALDCVGEKHTIEPAVKEQLDALLEKGREDPEPERRRVIAEALLHRRLEQMIHLHDEAFIDTSLVTCTEYQLFLDEQRAQGRYYQPDHWFDLSFPAGTGKAPILGVRRSDALAFCDWLTARDAEGWHYRLPRVAECPEERRRQIGLSAETGYWADDTSTLVWSHGAPSATLREQLSASITRAIDFTRDLPLVLDPVSDLVLDLDHTSNLALDLDRNLIFTHAKDLARIHDLAYNLARIRARTGNFAPIHVLTEDITRARDLAHDLARTSNLALAQNLYITLFLLSERINGALPAYEGILPIKERRHAF